MKCFHRLGHFSTVVRLVAMLLNTVSACVWGAWGSGAVPPYTNPVGPVLFIHALAGCLFTLPTLLLAEILGETPGLWVQRVFLLMGLVLFIPLGGVGIYLSIRGGTAVQISVATLSLAVGLLMLADFAHLEKLYCCYKIEPQTLT